MYSQNDDSRAKDANCVENLIYLQKQRKERYFLKESGWYMVDGWMEWQKKNMNIIFIY